MPYIILSEKELSLLRHLRQNSRKSLARVSKESDIPTSTLFDNLRRLESKAISRHVSLLDFQKLGYNVKANFAISASRKKELKDFLVNSRNVNSVSTLISDYDFFAECVFKDLREMSMFKDEIEKFGILNIHEHFIVEEVAREKFMPR